MKKLSIIIVSFLLIIINIIFNYNQNKDIYIGKKEEIKEESNNSIAIMLQNEDGEYVKSMENKWPTDGYVFNESYSGCENGGKLSWNVKTGAITLKTNKSDKCYVYFDKKENEPLNIDSVDVDSKSANQTVILTVNATGGVGKISYSVENTCTKCDDPVDSCGNSKEDISINNNIITIKNLSHCYKHSFTVKVQDESGTIVTSQVSDIGVPGNEICENCPGVGSEVF